MNDLLFFTERIAQNKEEQMVVPSNEDMCEMVDLVEVLFDFLKFLEDEIFREKYPGKQSLLDEKYSTPSIFLKGTNGSSNGDSTSIITNKPRSKRNAKSKGPDSNQMSNMADSMEQGKKCFKYDN